MSTMTQNQWVILKGDSFTITPLSKDGSVSLTYSWASDSLCGSNIWWTCAKDVQVGQVQSNSKNNFGEGWYDKVDLHNVKDIVQIASNNFGNLYLRVTSGTVSVAPNAVDIAPVPLPAAGVLLPLALVALAGIRKARK